MTLVTHSRYVSFCLDAAAVLAKEGVECEVTSCLHVLITSAARMHSAVNQPVD